MYIKNEDTICAPATVPGTGAISVIRVSGPDALAIADKVVRCRKGAISEAKGYSLKFGNAVDFRNDDILAACADGRKGYMYDGTRGGGEGVCGEDGGDGYGHTSEGTVVDEVLVSVFRAPHSYTGEDSVEISCHASSYIVSTIMDLLYAAGCRAASPGEFTERAFLNGKMDLAQAEAVADVIASQNAAAHRIAFNQMKGGFSSELREMRTELLEIVSLMELELDFSEEEVEFADRAKLDGLLEAVIGHVSRLVDSFKLGNAIKNGVPVAIAGATNTGKSTLLNALLGEDRAIVSDVHGTTRDTIEETLNIEGILFRFIDTAGIRETSEVVERIGIERTFKKISEASIVLGMIDLTRDFEESSAMVREILEKVDFSYQKLVFLLNKSDISSDNKRVNLSNHIVSAVNNKGVKCQCLILESESINYVNDRQTGNKCGIGKAPEVQFMGGNSENYTAFIIPVSAKCGTGISALRSLLASTQRDLLSDSGSATLVTNQRHAQALADSRASLQRVRTGLAAGLPSDLAAQDIREAIYHLGSIVGEISSDEVLGNIFKNFCIGK